MRNWMICIGLATILLLPGEASATSDAIEGLFTGDLQDLYGDEEFVSIATGSSKPIYKAPAVASVITAKEIEAMGARDLNEVLERVPGLHVSLSTQGRLDSIYSIRGIHTKFNPEVLFLMNGIPFPHFSGGRPYQFRLPVSAIARVEVIRGPGSAIYGADAFAGVINVITKEADDIKGTEIGSRAGSFDTHDFWLLHGRKFGKWDIAFDFEWQKSDGDSGRRIRSDLQTLLDQVFQTEASLAPGPLETRYNVINSHVEVKDPNWRFRYWYWRQEDAGLGPGSALALDPIGGEDLDQHFVDLTYRTSDLFQNLDISTNLNYLYRYSESRFVLLPAGTKVPIGNDGNLNKFAPVGVVTFPEGYLGNPSGQENVTGLDFSATYKDMIAHRWRFGAGIKHQEFEATREKKNFGPGVINGTEGEVDSSLTNVADTQFVFLPDSSRTIWYLSLQDEWQFARDWELTAGVRYDHYSDFGETINPRLALVWATRHNLTTKLLYGRAFRAPSIVEQFSINNPVALGNPDLDPETINTVEMAFDYRPTFNLQTLFTLFVYRADDLIEFIPNDNGMAVAQNARDQEGYGFEFEIDWKVAEKMRLYANYAWQRSEDATEGDSIADAPGQELYLGLDWRFAPDWSVFPQLTWIGSRKRAENDPRPALDDYTIVDLTLRRQSVSKHWDFAVAVRNLFDEDAREPSSGPSAPGEPISIPGDYPLAGRSFWGEIRYRF